MRISFR